MILESLVRRMLLRKTAFSGAYRRLSMLYSIKDPWNMASAGERHRFAETACMLTDIAPKFESILELGSGEGHQSEFLLQLTDRYLGLELSEKAVQRARQRCPGASFTSGCVEEAGALTQQAAFELTTACEVLYYIPNVGAALADLITRTRYLFVSNYLERAKALRPQFVGPGWRSLPNISHGSTIWECALWSRDEAGKTRHP